MAKLKSAAVSVFLVACGAVGIYSAHIIYDGWKKDTAMQACAGAIGDWSGPAEERIARVEKNCDHLPRSDQKFAAELASKQSGLIVYIPPYEAKQALTESAAR